MSPRKEKLSNSASQEKPTNKKKVDEKTPTLSATAGQGIFDKNGVRTVEYYYVPTDTPPLDPSCGY